LADAPRGVFAALGPGLLFAAAAVGVSHLVQSTRAGAVYGLSLVGLVLLANVVKYPAFRFGPQYAAATGTSLLEAYRRQGRWALVLYAVVTVGTMFTVQAAVTVVTAGLALATLGVSGSPIVVSAALMAVCAAMLAVGRYHWLDRITKVLVGVLTVCTLLATALVLPRVDWSGSLWLDPSAIDAKTLFFVAALVGWMPSAIDVSIWQSLWTVARKHDTRHAPTLRESMLDFHVGYVGTAILAVCFILMGAGVMHGSGAQFSPSAGKFAGQVIGLYTQTLGEWARPLIGASAFAVMFSTTLTVIDGFPRAFATLIARFRSAERSEDVTDSAHDGAFELDQPTQRRTYWVLVAVLFVGSMTVLLLLLHSLKTLVDVATTLSFLTAPVLAVLNHRAMLSAEVPAEYRPRPWLVVMSSVGIAFLGSFALYYLYARYSA